LNIRPLEDYYQKIDQVSGGRLNIFKNTTSTFIKNRASQAAAGLAYYAFFSLFPLLLVLISSGSYFLNDQEIYQRVIQFLQNAIPVSPGLIESNLRQVLDARGAVGIIGLLTLLWSASGFFTNLAHNINLAWSGVGHRSFIKSRLAGLGMIAVLILLLIMSILLDGVATLIPSLDIGNGSILNINLWMLISSLSSWLTIFLLFFALYRWVPATTVHWSASGWGALTSTIALKIATQAFSWYLQAGLGQYRLVYGSLGTIVALLFLIFIVSLITLFGAHLSAAIDIWKKENDAERSNKNGHPKTN